MNGTRGRELSDSACGRSHVGRDNNPITLPMAAAGKHISTTISVLICFLMTGIILSAKFNIAQRERSKQVHAREHTASAWPIHLDLSRCGHSSLLSLLAVWGLERLLVHFWLW